MREEAVLTDRSDCSYTLAERDAHAWEVQMRARTSNLTIIISNDGGREGDARRGEASTSAGQKCAIYTNTSERLQTAYHLRTFKGRRERRP